jgi:long-chain acyl-CoA synthetase
MFADGPLSGELAAASQKVEPARALLDSLPRSMRSHLPSTDLGGLLVYTSGTTGDPKGVLLREPHIGSNVAFAIDHFGYDSSWTAASVLPLFHTFTIVSDLLPMLVSGGRTIITSGFSMNELKATARAFSDFRVQSYSGVPIIFDTLLAMRIVMPDSLRFAVAGAAPLTEQTRSRYLKSYGHPIIPCYGLSESTCFAAASPLHDIRPGAVGRPANIEIEIFDEAGAPLPTGENGEVAMRGPSVLSQGYYKDGGKHQEAFTRLGWFLTGDIGRFDEDGYLYITGRKKNMLIRGGEKIYLEDVDRCLSTHPGVSDCCTIQVASGRHEERCVAFIVWKGSEVEKEVIVEHVMGALGPLSRPDEIVTTDQIPRSPSGKALREVLRSECEALG